MSDVLRDRHGNRIGEIRSEGGKLVIRDKNGNRLGSYDPKENVTRDASGNRYCTGNMLTNFLKHA